MLILYGTQTGNAKYVAEEIGRECTRRYIKAKVQPMDEYNITELPTERIVVFVVSTTGQGDPPATMKKSWRFLTRKDLPSNSLTYLNFTVFGLGDSSYEVFNAMARKLHQRLLQLGANCFHDKGLGDDQHDFGYEAEFDPWLELLWDKLYLLDDSLKHSDIKSEESIEDAVYSVQVIQEAQRDELLTAEEKEFILKYSDTYGRLNTLEFFNDPQDVISQKLFGSVVVNKIITSDSVRASEDKETRHIELDFDKNDLQYNPGDVCWIVPRNDTDKIIEFLISQKLNPNDLLRIRPNELSESSSLPTSFPTLIWVQELFEYWMNTLGVPNRYFFKVLAHFTEDEIRREKLILLSSKTSEGKNEYYRYCHREKRTHAEILHDFWTSHIPLGYLIQLIELQKLREFSISSSQLVNPSSIHLTVGVLRYKTIGHKRQKEGICSSYLSKLLPDYSPKVLCYIKPGTFVMPNAIETPIIWVAAGTGIAPFRSIIQDRVAWIKLNEEFKSEEPNIILFYGCRNNTDDDYYADEWESLTPHLLVIKAYSRVTDSKVYVQHKIRENYQLLAQLLVDESASVFIAGQSKFMPKSVEKAFIEVLSSRTDINPETYLKMMKKSVRYIAEAW